MIRFLKLINRSEFIASMERRKADLIAELATILKLDPIELSQNIRKYSWNELTTTKHQTKSLDRARAIFISIIKIDTKIAKKRLYQLAFRVVLLLICGSVIQILLPNLAVEVNLKFYEATVTLFPLILVAVYLSTGTRDPLYSKIHIFIEEKFTGVFAALSGTIASLWALGAGKSITSCFVIIVFCLVINFSTLFKAAAQR